MNTDDFDFGFTKPLNETTITELDALIKALFEKRREAEELENKAKDLNAQAEGLKNQVMEILEATGRTKHETPGFGQVYTQTKYQVSFPKDHENAEKFRAYLRETGMESVLTMNHQSLNAFFKEKLEEAGEGADPRGILPGIAEPQTRVVLAMKKGK